MTEKHRFIEEQFGAESQFAMVEIRLKLLERIASRGTCLPALITQGRSVQPYSQLLARHHLFTFQIASIDQLLPGLQSLREQVVLDGQQLVHHTPRGDGGLHLYNHFRQIRFAGLRHMPSIAQPRLVAFGLSVFF